LSETGQASEIGRVLGDYAKAWTAGDPAAIFAAYHEDFVLHYFGESPLAGSHRGKAAAMPVLMEATRRSGRRLLSIEDVLAGEGLGALVAREALGCGDDAREVRRILLYRVRDGQLFECWLFDEDQRFVDRLWSGA
jgi:ketosteroid isomerase-like protein